MQSINAYVTSGRQQVSVTEYWIHLNKSMYCCYILTFGARIACCAQSTLYVPHSHVLCANILVHICTIVHIVMYSTSGFVTFYIQQIVIYLILFVSIFGSVYIVLFQLYRLCVRILFSTSFVRTERKWIFMFLLTFC